MSQSARKKQSEKRTKKFKARKTGIFFVVGFGIFFIILALIFLNKAIYHEKEKSSDEKIHPELANKINESRFTKDGELIFLNKTGKKNIVRIDIEIAENVLEREKGLMYRHSMPETAGMLFVYERAEPLFFWMRNTYIPLDIIFADESRRIVTIQKNKEPMSYESIPSYRQSMYAVEVNAGFCDKYGIKVGDYIKFERY